MDKKEITSAIERNYGDFIALVNGLSDTDFERAPEGKWTPGKQLEHLVKSVRPLALALYLPESVLRWRFGKANRPSKTYDALVEKYLAKIQPGYVPKKQYIPRSVPISERDRWSQKLGRQVKTVVRHVEGMSEEQLDRMVAPHPAIGVLTLREMMYFTIYHAEHHSALVKRDQQILKA